MPLTPAQAQAAALAGTPAAAEQTLYGPRGEALMVTSRPRQGTLVIPGHEPVGVDLSKIDWNAVDGEIAKRVRSQGTSLTQVWDPRRGKPKPTSITFDTLRMMSNRNEWCSAIVKTRLNQIGKVKWSIKPKDEDDSSASTERLCDELTTFLKRPSLRGSRPHSRSWRQFIGEVLRDILVLDAGCIEKERNGRKWIVAMYPVDGATICPNIDERGGYHDDAYVQIVDGSVTARFGMEDLVYIMDNPQTDVRYAGYGYSPLEWLIVSVTADLYSSKYNSSYFEKGSVPEGLINLGEDAAPEDVDAFRLYWMNEVMGKPWSLPIIAGKGVEWIPWRQSNKDMEYMEYQKWLMQRMCAVYQIPPQEVGMIEDVNRSTADEQQESNTSKSIEPVLTLIEDYFEVEVIGEHGFGVGDLVKFEFDKEDQNEQWELQKFQVMVEAGAASRNELREAMGEEPREEEGADMLLVAGQLAPLPTGEDVEVMGAAAQQQHEDEQAQQQNQMSGVGAGTMPWKPANPDDPKFQDAKGQHDATSGMGPKQEPAPFGKTASDPHPAGRTPDVWHHSTWESTPPHHVKGAVPIHLGSEDAAKQRVFMRSGLPEHRDHNPTIHTYSLKPGTRVAHTANPVREKTAVTRPDFEDKLKAKGYHGYAYRNDREDAGSTSVKLFDRSRLVHHASDEYRVNKGAVAATHSCPGCSTGLVQAGHQGFALAAKPGASWRCPHCKTDWRSVANRPMPNVTKTIADRNPALTGVHDQLEDVFEDAQHELLDSLSRILGLPLAEVEELVV